MVPKCDNFGVITFCYFSEGDFLSACADYNIEFHSEWDLNFGTFLIILKPFEKVSTVRCKRFVPKNSIIRIIYAT